MFSERAVRRGREKRVIGYWLRGRISSTLKRLALPDAFRLRFFSWFGMGSYVLFALKGLCIPAQANGLGSEAIQSMRSEGTPHSADIACTSAFLWFGCYAAFLQNAERGVDNPPGRCPGLICCAPLGLEENVQFSIRPKQESLEASWVGRNRSSVKKPLDGTGLGARPRPFCSAYGIRMRLGPAQNRR